MRPVWLPRMGRYGLTAGVAAAVDLGGFLAAIALGVPLPPAAVGSFLVASVINYVLSARFTFDAPISTRGYGRFLAVACLGLAINVALTVLAAAAGAAPGVAKLLGIAVAFFANFGLNLVVVFATPRARSPRED